MLPALLSLTLLWSPVTETCRGVPTEGIRYEVSYRYWECERWEADHVLPPEARTLGAPLDVEESPACPRFEAKIVTEATVWETAIGSPDPPVGGGYFYRVESINALGLRSDEPC